MAFSAYFIYVYALKILYLYLSELVGCEYRVMLLKPVLLHRKGNTKYVECEFGIHYRTWTYANKHI